ncbi:FAD/NAD(P)-binding domain-containing protein [Pleomassaria siparia CBS 279.74]|uniref:FAD/NAD(P)-binding domain-containing protein n=1 Tax=Pleomassaria siparia CBS 279.74 TaxID=1314801 RepID=A0A6G1KLL2_9PLEO|nr:FAD/NAD(P)-binding domain-containing protein [Pleomassaria siparia CBS 279.74]
MSQKPLSILISGAGIAGSSLALALARQPNFNPKPIITLIERSSKPRLTGQAIDIRGPGVKVIRNLGLEEKIKARHTTETGIEFVDTNGAQVARFNASGDSDKQSAMTSEYEILRGDLATILLEELEGTKMDQGTNVNVVYGETIESLQEQVDGGGVTVEFSNGKLEPSNFDVVVSADGMSSKTREMMFEEYQSQECVQPWGWHIAYFTVPRIASDEDLWKWHNAPPGLAVHMRPHRSKKEMGVYLSMVGAKKEPNPEMDRLLSEDVSAQKAMLRERFKDVGWQSARLLDAMDQADDFYMQKVARIVTPTWTKGRFALVGDSAMATMGVGTTLAMMGAYILSGELAKTTSSDSSMHVATALSQYEKTLRQYYEKNSAAPSGFPQLANPQTQWGIGVMHMTLRFAYYTGLERLLRGMGDSSEEVWKLPDYGWKGTA